MGFSTLSVGWITAIRILKFFDHDFFQLPPKIRVAAGLDESLDPLNQNALLRVARSDRQRLERSRTSATR
jgi:hypothetical protein